MDCKGVKQLIVQCQKLMYGTMTESLLYYNKFRKRLEDERCGFNPYGPFVANNIIKGSQMTVCFHVEYYKSIHKSPKVVGKTITCIKQEYESIFEDVSGAMTFTKVR